jgi:hypothetical protein
MQITKWRKSIWKGYVLDDPNNMTFWKRKNYENSKGSVVTRGTMEESDK